MQMDSLQKMVESQLEIEERVRVYTATYRQVNIICCTFCRLTKLFLQLLRKSIKNLTKLALIVL